LHYILPSDFPALSPLLFNFHLTLDTHILLCTSLRARDNLFEASFISDFIVLHLRSHLFLIHRHVPSPLTVVALAFPLGRLAFMWSAMLTSLDILSLSLTHHV
jgi:hypothetical protein